MLGSPTVPKVVAILLICSNANHNLFGGIRSERELLRHRLVQAGREEFRDM